ncbi:bifunctional transcriptional activator/DNA repair enzyme AdaA [Pelosinus fermentans]|uniref:Transcriptional regulator with only HTH domain, AraC family n=1 Tax=Pelosinus fermentans JBW45 TaxID=1192197 RepID=I9DAY9_9FIRM|nr:Ada metal-binding domain-containing protein [Pelosinus fermentans]AJQ28976.1 transcriptional regulator with only HTH domain, AraC family [Pelosinus fermentans JBW45]
MTALTKDEKWKAVVHCDHSYDGMFFYGVKTTGIFCRPSCKSKEPKRNNVEFFDEIKEAYAYGLRPCKRCRPDLTEFRPMLDIIEKAKHIFDTHFADGGRLTAEIKELGVSQNHFIHLFRQQFQMTPVEYINRLRVEKAKQMLVNTELTIVNIALLCGFGSLSTFYEFFKKQVGLPPKEYRKQSSTDKG